MTANTASQHGCWEDYENALKPEYMEFIDLEAEAARLAHWQSDVIPGLLQTADYARQIKQRGHEGLHTQTNARHRGRRPADIP